MILRSRVTIARNLSVSWSFSPVHGGQNSACKLTGWKPFHLMWNFLNFSEMTIILLYFRALFTKNEYHGNQFIFFLEFGEIGFLLLFHAFWTQMSSNSCIWNVWQWGQIPERFPNFCWNIVTMATVLMPKWPVFTIFTYKSDIYTKKLNRDTVSLYHVFRYLLLTDRKCM